MKIKNVRVQCVTNKVIFKGLHTLEFEKFAVINEYAVPDVDSGESFPGDCNFAWTMWTGPTDGFFLMGGGTPGAPQMGIPFLLNNGNPSFVPGPPVPGMIKPVFDGYDYNQITAIDGSFVVIYSWPFSWFRKERVIHMVARRTSPAEDLKWRVAPQSEPTIPAAPESNDALKFTMKGKDGKWAVEMLRRTPP